MPEHLPATTTPQPRILIVDDDASHTAALAMLLEARGWRTDAASDTAAAIHALDGNRFDAVLSDISLGTVGGGFDIARHGRERHGDALLLVAYSGHASAAHRARATAAGFDRFIAKPMPARALLDALAEALVAHRAASAPARADVPNR